MTTFLASASGFNPASMIIGVDFDNTIVCYDGLFHRLAVEQGLVPSDIPPAKNAVRDYLRAQGQEDRWTELQGYTYGPGMRQARLFPGVLEFFDRCRRQGQAVLVISHRTRYPFLGPRHDLHQAARDFLAERGFVGQVSNLPSERPIGNQPHMDSIWFHETIGEKMARIGETGCTHFIDDLPEVLSRPDMPAGVAKILFDPHGLHVDCPDVRRFASWQAIQADLLGEEAVA